MRINRYLAYRYGSSRREADQAIQNGQVFVNSKPASLGQEIDAALDIVMWPGHTQIKQRNYTTLIINKPVGYVCSKDGQGSKTVYELLPLEHQSLKIAGRLDKDSSGLVLLTDNGDLIQEMSHPSEGKVKQYIVGLDKKLSKQDIHNAMIGVDIGDERPSRLSVTTSANSDVYGVSLGEGRNRQIRRTFAAMGYTVRTLHRVSLGDVQLGDLPEANYQLIK